MDTRYSRQLLFAPIGKTGQEKLAASRVVIVGAGALGAVLANHMVRAGVGYVRIIDRDFVEPSNLQRQMLYDEDDAAAHLPKAIAAAEKLRRINSGVTIDPVIADIIAANAETLLGDCDLILDGTDNFAIRFLINDVAVKHGIPWIYGGAVSAKGMFAAIRPHVTPCLRCFIPEPPVGGETCDTAGVIGPIIHIVASYQAVEALKLLVGDEKNLNPNLEHMEIWRNMHTRMNIANNRNPECPTCGKGRFEFLELSGDEDTVTSLCGRNSVQISPAKEQRLNLEELEKRFTPLGEVERNKFLLRFHIGEHILVIFPNGRVVVQGTDDISTARSLYAKYIGA
ncbi:MULTISPECIES: ThiF family adenylyltransferase [Aneurinibacillus]|jgi:adenylyltransferase/sulfurtransferase|uniref:Thiamine/molybdopterin biosynthesis protein MoeB n=1 Tax=Aneurinibacillus danicus TaxID=267746 RepID=A0A511VC97_9BACL|nr:MULTISPECIES: ThiF family adenylyltransferase [Aneurinibacillus]GEN36536.1 thiamine/molybdopterin biosynthesis protein MoeB [Aneurinibacillus danicus]